MASSGQDPEATKSGRMHSSESETLEELYQKWAKLRRSRTELFRKRIDAAWMCVKEDIARSEKAIAEIVPEDRGESDRLLQHHIEQFRIFCTRAFEALIPVQTTLIDELNPEEVEDFRALLVGVFTAQWLLMRDAVLQRVSGSPYRTALKDLDKRASAYYAQLYHAIGRHRTSNPLKTFPPLVHISAQAQLTVFNSKIPLMLSIPLGAVSDEQASSVAKMAIPHEIAHAVLAQLRIVEETKRRLKEEVVDKQPRRDRVLYELVLDWSEEIYADLLATALAGEEYARSALSVMAGSLDARGISDPTHPLAALRPLVHLQTLRVIEQKPDKHVALQTFFQRAITTETETIQLFNRQFRSVPALMFVTLRQVGDVMIKLIGHLLDLRLEDLGNVTVKDFLVDVYSSKGKAPKLSDYYENWPFDQDDFVLDFPQAHVPLVHGMPGVSLHPLCCIIPGVRDWLKCDCG